MRYGSYCREISSMQFLVGAIFLIWLLLTYGWVKVGVGFGLFIVCALPIAILMEKERSKSRRRGRRVTRTVPSQSAVHISWRVDSDQEGSAIDLPKCSEAPIPSRSAKANDQAITRGIIIRAEHLEDILKGHKTWEMRSRPFNGRETIGLIRKGSKAIYGVADVVDCKGPLSRKELNEAYDCHRIQPHDFDDPKFSKYTYAWVLENVRRTSRPVSYVHKSGPVVFVRFDAETSAAIEASL